MPDTTRAKVKEDIQVLQAIPFPPLVRMIFRLLLITAAVSIGSKMNVKNKQIGIIGAGASGIAACKVLKELDGCAVTVLEQRSTFGGIWRYNPEESAMYNSLRTNLPKEIMGFSNEDPIEATSDNSFIGHADVLCYLEAYIHKYSLEQYISYNIQVRQVTKDVAQWNVQAIDTKSNQECDFKFDYLVICNGHYDTPCIPALPGAEYFKGKTMHACRYDDPKVFAGLRVVVVGGKSSGTDLAREISAYASAVHVSERSYSEPLVSHGRITLHPGLSRVEPGGHFRFVDGTTLDNVDVLLWCTGYLYDFPFLYDAAPHESIAEPTRQVRGLYHSLISAEYPSLAFMGLPYSVVPFPLFHLQAQWIATLVSGRAALPSREVMLKSIEEFEEMLRTKDLFDSKYHYMGAEQFPYMRYLATAAGVDSEETAAYIDMLEGIFLHVSANKPEYVGAPDTYRSMKYTIDRYSKFHFVR